LEANLEYSFLWNVVPEVGDLEELLIATFNYTIAKFNKLSNLVANANILEGMHYYFIVSKNEHC
jgi:hypothetical protein